MLRAAFFLGQSPTSLKRPGCRSAVKSRIRLAFGKLRKVLEQERG